MQIGERYTIIKRQIGVIDMNKLTNNAILNTDSYKTTHFLFMNPRTTYQYSYGEARTNSDYPITVFTGLQRLVKDFLTTRITMEMVDQAEPFIKAQGLYFNREGWEYIVKELGGKLPLRIKAVPEGMQVPIDNVLYSVENTDPKCAWLTSYFEPPILRSVWYASTVATRSFFLRELLQSFLEETGEPDAIEGMVEFKLVDFGSRGASSKESAENGGAAHLINFMSTDNLLGVATTMDYYNSKEVTGGSIPASEHTVTIAEGQENEKPFFERAIDVFLKKPGDMVSVVSDSYSFENALKIWGELREKVEATGGTVVVRPDSGDPTEMVMLALRELSGSYGYTTNGKGYKVLNPSVRIIQGDGVNLEKVREILETMKENGFAAENVTFGCGGYLLQDLTRDTQRFAMKGSYVEIDGEIRDVRKTTETDPTKASKAGRVILVKREGVKEPVTIREEERLSSDIELLETVFLNGELVRDMTFQEVRENARRNW